MTTLRDLPSVDRLLQHQTVRALLAHQPRDLVLNAAREVLEVTRQSLLHGDTPATTDLPAQVAARVQTATHTPLRAVINATGVIIHTNLGRAPLSLDALEAVRAVAEGYSNLEYDLDAGARGSRHSLVTDLLRRLTGAEDALVVNNNAAALLLILSALAQGREAIISRGQLVEIGGGFRIPDVMRESGVTLVEVGTTNRTYAHDYTHAVTDRTALLLRVHSSNFLQVGFTHSPSLAEMVAVAAAHGLTVVDDLGSGSLRDTSRYGLAREPLVQESVAAGAALVCFSGDKLLGGPQAGIVVGRAAHVGLLRKHPLMRALRPDKMTFAALGATLLHYLRNEAEEKVPVWQMLAADLTTLEARGATLVRSVPASASVVPTAATVGGGSLPGQSLPSRALALAVASPDRLAAALRRGTRPVVGRIEADRLLLDLRTVLPHQDDALAEALRTALGAAA